MPCPTPTVTVRSLGTMSPPANTPGAARLERCRHPHRPVALELHTGHVPEERGVGVLTERQDHGVGRKRLEPPGRLREAGLVELHQLDLQLGPVEGRDRPQPVDPYALTLGVLRLLEMRRHLLARSPVDDQRLVGPEPAGDPGGVHRRVASPVDGHPPTDLRPLARRDAPQERQRIDDPAGVPRGDVHPLGQVRPNRDEDRVESALQPLGSEILHLVATGHPHAHRRDPADLAVEDIPWQPVGRDPVAHHPARLAAGVADLDLVPEPSQMVGGREAARTGTDHEHALAAASRRRVEEPPLLEREIAEEPLDGMNRHGAVEARPVADALARVITDPPVDRRKRIVRRERTPRLLVPAGLRVRQPSLDVLARRAARITRRQQIDVHRPASPDRPRVRAPVQ